MTTLDRYLIAELVGPSLFGLTAFTLIFVATQLLALGRLVSEEHAPFFAAVEYFLWDMPQFVLLAIPMALLLGTLLAMQRLSGESEITAMKAGGVSLGRIVVPLLAVGFAVSLVSLAIQETFVPLANDRAAYVKSAAIQHLSPVASNLTVVTSLPGGGKQVTIAGALDPATQSLLNVTVLRYNAAGHLDNVIVAARANYVEPTWSFVDATTYAFSGTNDVAIQNAPSMTVDVGQKPNQIAKQAPTSDPEQLSRAEIHEAIRSGQLSPQQLRTFSATDAAKLARPFAATVFVLIAVSFGLRPVRGGGGTGLGFGVAVAIVFVYYVISTICLSLGSLSVWLAGIMAWTPNVLFSAIGVWLLRRASAI